MGDWNETTLAAICADGGLLQTGPFGSQLHASDYIQSGGVPVIMPKDLKDSRIDLSTIARTTEEKANQLSRHRVKVGDLVYSRRGDIERHGRIGPAEEGLLCGTGCLLVRPGAQVDPRFLSYYLNTQATKNWLQRHAVGATMPNINTSILGALPLRLPDLTAQHGIASVLGALDDKVVTNERQINLVQELFFAESMALGRSGGDFISLKEVASWFKGISYKSSELVSESPTGMVSLKSVGSDGSFQERGIKPFSGNSKPQQVISAGEVVVACTDLTQDASVIGRAIRVPRIRSYTSLVASLDISIVRSINNWPPVVIFGLLAHPNFQRHCLQFTSGTTVLHLGQAAFENYRFPAVTDTQARSFAERTYPSLELLDQLRDENCVLAELRDSLLPGLMSGVLTVRKVEDLVSEVI